MNNFLNNAEQKIILCRILEIVYAKNSEKFYLIQKKKIYECNKNIRIYSKHDM